MDKMTGIENKCHIVKKAFTKAGKRTVIKHYSQEPFTAHSLRILSFVLSENTDKNIFHSKFFCQQNTLHKSIYSKNIFSTNIQRKVYEKKGLISSLLLL